MAGNVKSQGFDKIDDILTKSAPKIFDFNFPIFDDDYKLPLEKKILMHYYTREIGEESYGLWKLRLATRMNEIMPYYNKLYKSELIEFDPLHNVDLTTTHEKINDGNTTNDATGKFANSSLNESNVSVSGSGENHTTTKDNNTTMDAYSDTPQGMLENVESLNYLTNAKWVNENDTGSQDTTSSNHESTTENVNVTNQGTTEDKSTVKINNTEEYLEHIVGKTPGISMSKMIEEYRDTLLNIDMMIINDLSDLFFGLWE